MRPFRLQRKSKQTGSSERSLFVEDSSERDAFAIASKECADRAAALARDSKALAEIWSVARRGQIELLNAVNMTLPLEYQIPYT